VGVAIVNCGAPTLVSVLVTSNTMPAAEAVEGCVVMVVVVVAVGTHTITSTVNGHPGSGSQSNRREGYLRNSGAPTMACPNDEPAF